MRPPISAEEAAAAAREHYGLSGRATSLPSETDRNFKLVAKDGQAFVLKIGCVGERGAGPLEAQNEALGYLGRQAPDLNIPRLIANSAGRPGTRLARPGLDCELRVFSWVEGIPLARHRPHSPLLLESIGALLGKLDRALIGFDHVGAHRTFQWDLRRADQTFQACFADVSGESRRRLAEKLFERSWSCLAPEADHLRRSVIHGDGNDHNLVVAGARVDSAPGSCERIGLVDFGDLNFSWTIAELAIACAYLLMGKSDPLAALTATVRGYHRESPISELEMRLLFDLIVVRLLVSAGIGSRNARRHPDDEYLQVSQAGAWELLARLEEMPAQLVHYAVRGVCGLEPHPVRLDVDRWLRGRAGGIPSLTDRDLAAHPPVQVELSLDSVSALAFGDRSVEGSRLQERPGFGIGQFAEARMPSPAGGEEMESATVHLGRDLLAPVGTTVRCPLDGKVFSSTQGKSACGSGGTLVLSHRIALESSEVEFWTLYRGLREQPAGGWRDGADVAAGDRLGEFGPPEDGRGPVPCLHVQLVLDLLGLGGDFPGFCRPSKRELWLGISPDPAVLLGIPESPAGIPGASLSEDLRRRRLLLGPSLSLSYNRPLKIVRGRGQFLIDQQGRSYLDCINNVAHVGHAHPVVVEAAHQQNQLLNTNTRFLHDGILRYSERLISEFPEPLRVCFFVCSGSEANELALRLARARTGEKDFLVLAGGYHGNTSALIEVSPYKFDGPGGSGCPRHVQVVAAPDDYRGPFKRQDERAGLEYARLLADPIRRLEEQGRGVAAFLCESILGCGGQIVPPPGYLQECYRQVRDRGGLCIADEVQTGFGRVGSHFWAFELQGVVPDIVTLGKPMGNGHPLAAVVTTPEIAAAFANGMEYFNTFGGNPVSCATGLAVLDVLSKEGLQEQALQVGQFLRSRLGELLDRFPLVGDVRGEGLFLGVELVLDRETLEPAPRHANYLVERMKERGFLLSTDGPWHNVIKIKPPLVFTRADANRLVDAMAQVLSHTVLGEGQA